MAGEIGIRLHHLLDDPSRFLIGFGCFDHPAETGRVVVDVNVWDIVSLDFLAQVDPVHLLEKLFLAVDGGQIGLVDIIKIALVGKKIFPET